MPKKASASNQLRWQAQVRTKNGAITTYVRVRAWTIDQAAERAALKAYITYKDFHDQGQSYGPTDWFVIYVALYAKDHNRIKEGSR